MSLKQVNEETLVNRGFIQPKNPWFRNTQHKSKAMQLSNIVGSCRGCDRGMTGGVWFRVAPLVRACWSDVGLIQQKETYRSKSPSMHKLSTTDFAEFPRKTPHFKNKLVMLCKLQCAECSVVVNQYQGLDHLILT